MWRDVPEVKQDSSESIGVSELWMAQFIKFSPACREVDWGAVSFCAGFRVTAAPGKRQSDDGLYGLDPYLIGRANRGGEQR